MTDGIQKVQVEALAVMKIIKHARESYPTVSTGSLVGMDVGGTLEITNCFAFPTIDLINDATQQPTLPQNESLANAAAAASAPRAKSNNAYQVEMIKYLREVNVDANNVGWYTSTTMGNFVNINTIENQFFYQKEMNERTVALVYDGSRSVQGNLALKAYRLNPSFMTAFKEGKFNIESLQKSGLRYNDILVEIPVFVHNSHIITTLLHQLPLPLPKSSAPPQPPSSLNALLENPLATNFPLDPNYDALDLSIDPFLEKTCDLLLESVEQHHTELNNHQYYARSLAREQAKITAWQAKRKAENATRAATKQPLLPEDEYLRLFKLPTEPSRLEIMLNSRQIEQYSRQVDGFTGAVGAKMFGVKSNLMPGEG